MNTPASQIFAESGEGGASARAYQFRTRAPSLTKFPDIYAEPENFRFYESMTGMEASIQRIQLDLSALRADFRQTLGSLVPKIDAIHTTVPHLATKAELAEKPGKGFIIAAIGVAVALVMAGWQLGKGSGSTTQVAPGTSSASPSPPVSIPVPAHRP